MRLNVQLSTHEALGPTPSTNNSNNDDVIIYNYMHTKDRVPNPVFNQLYT